MATRLGTEAIAENLKAAPGWELRSGKLFREFVFADFKAAFAFMTECAAAAEELDHHPEWTNIYNRVSVYLMTHSVDGLSDLDFELARDMARLALHHRAG